MPVSRTRAGREWTEPVKIFDAHVHFFPDPIAARAVAALAESGRVRPSYDGTRAGLLRSMAAAGVHGSLNCPVATRPDQVESINAWAAAQNQWPVLSLGSVHPRTTAPARVLAAIRDQGLAGVKLHPEYQEFEIDDPGLTPVWRACCEQALVAFVHCGADIAYPPPYRSSPAQIRRVLDRFPDLRFVAAHFGSWRMWDEVERLLIGLPVYLDLSFTFGLIGDARLLQLVRAHGVERVLFATDAPWRAQDAELAYFRRLPFTESEREQILWQNAADLFGFPAKTADTGPEPTAGAARERGGTAC